MNVQGESVILQGQCNTFIEPESHCSVSISFCRKLETFAVIVVS